MSRAETKAYIQAHLSAARREPGLFTAEAIAQVYEHTEGLPRLINQLCDHALLLALADGREPLDADLIGEAWADLQQLPTMHIGEPLDDFGASGGDILEFGALADHERPVERIGAIQEQLASISMESATGPRSFNRFDSADAGEVDFSLPENEWPELEVVLRESAAVAAGDYVDEEVIADPFHKSPAFHTPHWPPAREPAIPGTGGGQIVAPASVAAGNVPPLESVPLMVHVETNLFAPDPVWPDEELHDLPLIRPLINQEPLEAPAPAAQIVVPGGSARPDHSPPPSRVPPPATARRHGPKRFAKLFSSLQD
jgi:hypothetical protein